MHRSRSGSHPVEQESDDFVSIDARSDFEAQVRVTCPDKTGLGSDIARTVFDFGLVTTKGDFATDGKWAFVLVTVVAQSFLSASRGSPASGGARSGRPEKNPRGAPYDGAPVNWNLLRVRLENLCPSKQSISTLSSLNLAAYAGSDNRENASSSRDHLSHTGGGGGSQGHVNEPRPGTMYILQVEVEDRVGLLHDVTQELWASELTVRRAHISTSPADTAVDLFYVTDERDELPAEARVAEISRAVQRVSGRRGGGTARVVLTPAPAFVSARRSDAARLFEQGSIGRIETASATQYTEATVTVDNLMSEKHTVFQIRTRDRKGLLYDVLRASKDLEVKVNYAKVEMRDGDARRGRGGDRNSGSSRETRLGVDDDDHGHGAGGHLCEIDLFVGRCTDVRERRYLCQRYKENVERPVSVQIMTAGLDETTTELRVIAPLDISGFTRPRVLLDVTEALRQLQVMVFKADILIDDRSGDRDVVRGGFGDDGRYGDGGGATRCTEVHRFLLTDAHGQPISSVRDRKVVCNRVLGVLLQ
jgi:hypothetical protein